MASLETSDLLRLSSGAIRGHPTRSMLSMLGSAIGVAAVVLLTSLGEGARRYIVAQFSQFGTNVLAIGVWNRSRKSSDLVLVPRLAWAGVRITKGPYLQKVTPTSIVICWETREAASSRVSYGAATAGEQTLLTGRTDSAGRFVFNGLGDREVTLTANHPQLGVAVSEAVVVGSENVNLRLGSGTLAGRVTLAGSGTPEQLDPRAGRGTGQGVHPTAARRLLRLLSRCSDPRVQQAGGAHLCCLFRGRFRGRLRRPLRLHHRT